MKQATTIGKLRHRIEIQSLSIASDGQGGGSTTWTPIKTIWAEITPTSSRERLFAQRIEDVYDHKITIRKQDFAINSTMRILFMTKILQIKSVQPFENDPFFIQLLAQEKAGT